VIHIVIFDQRMAVATSDDGVAPAAETTTVSINSANANPIFTTSASTNNNVTVVVRVRKPPTYAVSLTAGFHGDYDPSSLVVRSEAGDVSNASKNAGKSKNCTTVFVVDPTNGKESSFGYDSVLAAGESQEEVYGRAVKPLIER
jgi:hypothetical protein